MGAVEQDVAEDYRGCLLVDQSVALEQAFRWTVENVGYVRLPGFSLDV
jgi:hypothetical protein